MIYLYTQCLVSRSTGDAYSSKAPDLQRSVYAHSLICISYRTYEIDYCSLFCHFILGTLNFIQSIQEILVLAYFSLRLSDTKLVTWTVTAYIPLKYRMTFENIREDQMRKINTLLQRNEGAF
jgi:hypothetical protein